MKELSIEEKAKRYDEAIKRIEDIETGKCKKTFVFTEGLFEHIFPELKESEDERIRKELIFSASRATGTFGGIPWDRVVAWLEKQGKSNMGISEATKQELENNLNKALEKETPESWNEFLEKQGEQKPADKIVPKFKVGQTIKKKDFNLGFTIVKIEDGFYYNDKGDYFPFTDEDNWELVEQKPAWSEEDDKMVNHISKDLDELEEKSSWKYIDEQVNWLKSLKDRVLLQPKQEWTNDDTAYLAGVMETELYMLDVVNGIKPFSVGNKSIKEECEKELEWLKSLESRVLPQPKQEWSEEDEEMCQETIDWFEKKCFPYALESENPAKESIKWLKHLKERYTWKPSDEQIEALESATENCAYSEYQDCLRELIGQLKKLKG